jgi:Tol biopolymer transport system component
MFPAWSPDNSQLVVAGDRDGDLEVSKVYLMNPDGTGQGNLTNHPEGDWMYGQGCSPDGMRIVFGSSRDGN